MEVKKECEEDEEKKREERNPRAEGGDEEYLNLDRLAEWMATVMMWMSFVWSLGLECVVVECSPTYTEP